MTLDEKSATCIALIARASENNAKFLLDQLSGDARMLGLAIISVKENRNSRVRFRDQAKAILDLVESNRRKNETYQAIRKKARQQRTELAHA